MKQLITRLRLLSRIAGWLLAATAPAALADTIDLTENFSFGGTNQTRCADTTNSSIAVFADIDGNNVFDTLVVFVSLEGEAVAQGPSPFFGYGNYHFFFTGDRSNCGGTTGGLGRIGIRFVNMLAAGFDQNNPATWTYKSVPGVQLVVASDGCVETGSANPFREVKGYTELNQGGTLIGSFTTFYWDSARPLQSCDFTTPQGVKEVMIRTHFCENDVRHLVIHSNSASGGADAGLRVRDGGSTVRIACEMPVQNASLLSPVQFRKNGSNYGVILTDVDSPSASRIRIKTGAGIKAWMKLP